MTAFPAVTQSLEQRALLSGVPFQSFHANIATALPQTGSDWEFDLADWNGDGTKDLFAINKRGASGTEVSILNGATGFQTFLKRDLPTALGQTDASWTFEVADWSGDGRPDVIGIARQFGGMTGFTVLSGWELPAASIFPFQNFINGLTPVPTTLHQTDASWEFEVADWNGDGVADIFAFDKTGAVVNGLQRTDIHIMDGSGPAGSFLFQRSTVLPATNGSSWDLLLGGNNDIVAVKKNGTGTNTTEVHVPTVTNGFQSYFLQTSTALHQTNANWQFEFKEATGDGNDDLIAIATSGTASGRTEVHILTGIQESLTPGSTISLPTTDGGTVEGTIDAASGTLLIELDGNDVTVPASLAGHKIVVKGPGAVSFEGASNAGELLVDAAGFQLTSGARINGDRLELRNGSQLVIPAGTLNVDINSDVDITDNSTATIHASVPTEDVNVTQSSEIAIAAGGNVQAKSVNVSGNSQAKVLQAGIIGIDTSLNVDETSELIINGTVNGPVNVNGTLSGSGVMNGPLTLGIDADVRPGNSPGRLRTGSLEARAGTRFEFELFGTAPGSQYDQIDVTGSVQLGGATLQAILGFSPALGQEFVIIRNDGTDAVSGTFQGLPEGASLNVGGKRFHITYRGGTGNDVVLQRNQLPSGGSTLQSVDEDTVLRGTVPHSDPDGDTTTVQLVSGPTDAALFSLNLDGSFSYEPAAHVSGGDSFTYRVSDGELLSSIYTVEIDVEPVADTPTLTVQNASGDENDQIPLNITSGLVDQDGSESLSLQISGVPDEVTLNQGIDLGGGVWTLSPSQLQGLTLRSLDNQTFTLDVTATASESANGEHATVGKSLTVTVENVAPALENVTVTPSIEENGLATLTGDIIDPGTQDSFTLTVDWGDGSAPETFNYPAGTGSFSETHQYLDDGPGPGNSGVHRYTISTELADKDDGVSSTASFGPAGPEFRINTTTPGSQSLQGFTGGRAVASDSAGRFVVVWTGPDGDGAGIFAQRFDADGVPLAGEFRVNSQTSGSQQSPAIGMSSDGRFVIAWNSFGQDGDGDGVYAQRFSATGAPVGTEFRGNTETSGRQSDPGVAMDEAGNFVLVWHSLQQDGDGLGVFARRFDSDGNPLGHEFQVNTYTSGDQFYPSVAMNASGQFVITWGSAGQDGSGGGVYGQRYESDGTAAGTEFRINSEFRRDQYYPSVAMTDDGGFVVVWDSFQQDGDGFGIFGQRFVADGTAAGGEFRVNSQTADSQSHPSVAVDNAGNFVVAWTSLNQDGDSAGVYGQRFDASGLPAGDEFPVNSFTAGSQQYPSVALDTAGQLIVVWQSRDQDGSANGVYGQRYVTGFESSTVEVTVNNKAPDLLAVTDIQPAAFGSLRDNSQPLGEINTGDGFISDRLLVNSYPSFPSEDRGLIEFPVDSLPETVVAASLDLTIARQNGDQTVPLEFSVYGYAGNGTVGLSDADDFQAGTYIGNFTLTDEPVGTVISIDVTAAVNDLLTQGVPYAGLNIQFSGPEPPLGRYVWFNTPDITPAPELRVTATALSLSATAIDEDGTVSLTGSFTDPGTLDEHAVVIDWGDGTLETLTLPVGQRTFTADHQYLDDGPTGTSTDIYNVSATVTDDDGGTAVGHASVTVNNVAPVPAITGVPATASEGETIGFGSTIADPGSLDTHTLAWSVTKNGSAYISGSGTTFDVTPDDNGMYEVSLTVTDDDGGVGTATETIEVSNVAPSIAATHGSITVNEADTAANSGTFFDPGADIVTLSASVGTILDNGDGTWSWSWSTSDGPDDSQTVTITATDSDGAATSADFDLTVNNVAPAASDAAFDLVENSSNGTVVGSMAATDPGEETLTWSIASGNESGAFAIDPATGVITVADSTQLDFETTPVFELEVTVTDDDRAADTADVTINLLNQASLTGAVFVDANQNGLYDANELGIDGVAVDLLNTDGDILDTVFTSDGGFYLFDDLDPDVYRIRETQPTGVADGTESLGTLGGNPVGNDVMEVPLARIDGSDYDFAEIGQQLTSGDTASIGFWQNKHGQALITSGGTALAEWLTSRFGNVFGDKFAGASGTDIADFYKDQLFRQKGKKPAGPAKVDARFMAVALSTFFTSSHLAGTVAAGYGFNVTHTGIGTSIVNVGQAGAAFGVADDTELTIMQLLLATNSLTDQPDNVSGFARIYDQNGDGVIDAAEQRLRWLANDLFAWITGFSAD
ncbi:MAG: SdrD B-like domain-containing protein [Fuerstiella sp.]